MLAVPLKTTKGVDWSGPLRGFMEVNYTPEEFDKHASSIQRLSTTRERVANANGAQDNSIDALESYLTMLGQVEPRFPLGERGLKISFTWFDALQPQKKQTVASIEYERASVLFNLGAVLSHQGMVQDRNDIGGLKKACAFFQRAAGIFLHLKDNVIAHNSFPVLTDMSPEGLDMLYNLMMAQAQACFYEKAIRDEMKAAVLSKLSAQALIFYDKALNAARTSSLSTTLDPAWALHLEFQSQSFGASTQLQHSKVVHARAEEEASGYGEEVSRLNLASEICAQAIATARRGKLPQSMLDTTEHLEKVIHRRLDQANQDNNRIYMEVIPKTSSLSTPPAASLAKPMVPNASLTDVANVGESIGRADDPMDDTLFAGLLPVVMQEAEAMYQSKLSGIVEQYGKKVQDAAEEVKLRLSEANLPAAVEAGEGSEEIPDAVWGRIQNVVSRGAYAGLRSGVQGNEALGARIFEALREIEQKLDEEEREDARAKQTWGPQWELTSSVELNQHMRRDVERYRSLLNEARQSDEVLQQKLSASKGKLDILSFSRSQLNDLFPTAEEVNDNPEVEATRADLAVMLVTLGSNIQECENLQGQLVDEISSDSIARAMSRAPGGAQAIAANKSKLNALIDKEAAKYKPMLQKIDKRIGEQPGLLSRVLDKNFEFSKQRNQSEAMLKREGVIAEVDQAIATFEELWTYVGEGEKFYQNLSGRIDQLRTTAFDHCYVRELQRNELEEELARRAGGGGGGGGGGASNGGSYPGMQQEQQQQQRGLSRQGSMPFMSPYAVGGAAEAYPLDDGAAPAFSVQQPSQPPPPSYSQATGGDDRQAKLQTMKSTLGSGFGDARLEEALDGAGGDVNIAINHILGADPPSSGGKNKRHSKGKRFGLFK